MEDVDTITGERWNAMTPEERNSFNRYWHERGNYWFMCIRCGYPLAHGWSACDACAKKRNEK